MADIYIGNIKGPQGNPGATGETGATGAPGAAATIEVGTVSTTAYGNTAQVTNSGTENAAVFDFVIPQGRPGEETTRMSALTLDTVTASTATFPVPATGEVGATVFGKIIKFFNDTVSALSTKVNVSDIVNNLTSTVTNKPLSAAQGKALNDAIASKMDVTSHFYQSASGTNSIAFDNSKYKFVSILIVSGNYACAALIGSRFIYNERYIDIGSGGRIKCGQGSIALNRFMFNEQNLTSTASMFVEAW